MSTPLYSRPMNAIPRVEADAAPADWVAHAAERMEGAGLVFGHGTGCASDEACWMLSHVLSIAPDFGDRDLPETLNADAAAALNQLLEQRISTRKPLAYLLGTAWFAGLCFAVDESTLVPRSPLAEIAVDGMSPWLDFDGDLKVLEIGTGSGCLAAAMAHYWPRLDIDATDIDEHALERAQANLAQLKLTDRVCLIQSDVYDELGDRRYDLIVSNPPYVPTASMRTLPKEYRHEPALALAAGDDGLDIFRRLLANAPTHLHEQGWLLVELGEAAPAAEALLHGIDHVWLDFERGGDGVVLLDRAACLHAARNLQ